MRHFQLLPLAFAVSFATAYAQDNATDTEQDQADSNDQVVLEEVMVQGIRESMKLAQDIKQNSDSILDAIVAEDIGKLPDLTAAESIARIPGVQVTRNNDEANAVLIRGLPDVTTTYNGREFFSNDGRRAQLMDFPSQAIAGIEVYKSGTADLIEPGLAGLINVRTRRPFDFDGQVISGALHYSYNDQSENTQPSGNILYSNRWDTDLGEMGLLVNATYAAQKFHNGTRYNSTWIHTAGDWGTIEEPYSDGSFYIPNNVGLYNTEGKRWRPSANYAYQWQVNDDLVVYAEGIFQGYRGKGDTDNFNFDIADWDWLNGTGAFNLSNIVMVDGTDNMQVASLTKSGGLPPNMFRSTYQNKTNTFQNAVGAILDTGRWHIETDLAYTDSNWTDNAFSFDSGLSYSPTFNVNFSGDEGGVVFDSPDWDPMDLSNYEARGYYEAINRKGGEGWQWRTDFTLDTGWGDWLHTLKTGIRYSERNSYARWGDRYAWFWDKHIPLQDIDFLDFELTRDPFRSAGGITQYMAPTLSSIQANVDELRTYVYDAMLGGWDEWRRPAWENSEITVDPANRWLAEEQNYAIYLQGKSHFELGSVGLDVYPGVRIAQTDSQNTGTSTVVFEGETSKVKRVDENSYVDVLPNISVRAMLTDTLQLRAGFTKTRTKPNFGDLNPALNITQIIKPDIDPPPGYVDPGYDADGSGGNPDLEPLTSKNYDISLEWYFSDNGYMSAAAFYRDLWGFTNWYQRLIEDPVYGTVRLNHPENAGEGKIQGWELNASTFLDFDGLPEFLSSWGVSANVTFLKGRNRLPDGEGNFGDFVKIPGLSKYTYNAAVFYEMDRFSARLSYNHRDEWVNWYGTSLDGSFSGNKSEATNRLDFSASFDVTDNIAVWGDVSNILAEPFKTYTVTEQGYKYYQDVRDEGRYFGLGIRFDY